MGWVIRDEHPGCEAEQRQTRIAQKAATSEADFRELLLVEIPLEIHPLIEANRHTRLPPLDRFLLCDLHQASVLLSGVTGFHELHQG